jgi:hypothetical protein
MLPTEMVEKAVASVDGKTDLKAVLVVEGQRVR